MLREKLSVKKRDRNVNDLEQAFNNFNDTSDYLTEVYMNLERQVSVLNTELVSVSDERAQEFHEKERIAKQLQNLLKVLPAGIVVLDNNGLVQECNPAAVDLLGEPLKGLAWSSIVERAFSPRWDDGHDVTLVNNRCVNISTQSLEDDSGQLVLIKETTETKILQHQLDRLKRLSAMGDLASSLAHQIRTPLSTALLYASHLRRANLETGLHERFVGKLMGRLQHLESIVEDMLLFARGGRFESKPVLFAELLSEFKDSIEPQLEQSKTRIKITNTADKLNVDVNRSAIISIFQNIVNNAIQACVEPLNLKINVKHVHDNTLEICFTDNGPGIDEKIQDRIFEPFFTTREEGTGLGLTVAQAVLMSHGGQIKMESTLGKGTTFRILLPVIQ